MEDALAALLLPSRLEEFARQAHARDLLSIPRVVALEPGRLRPPRFMRDAACLRQARRLRLPGQLRLALLYDPAQYPLARGLLAYHQQLELWYAPPAGETPRPTPQSEAAELREGEELREFDQLAREHAVGLLEAAADGSLDDMPLRLRLQELEVISPRAFVAGARTRERRW